MMDNGKMIYLMERVYTFIKMETGTKATLCKVKSMALVF